jgi:hypothetical protein
MKLAEVHTLYDTNCRSIPDMMRQAADSIETEVVEGFDPTKAMIAVQISESGQIQIYGWGDTNDMHAAGVLMAGVHELMQGRRE